MGQNHSKIFILELFSQYDQIKKLFLQIKILF